MLIVHFLGLAMSLGTGFSHLFLGMVRAKMEKEESDKLLVNTLFLNYLGKTGLTLLILSGGYLMTPWWGSLMGMTALMIKLILVLVLTALMVLATIYGKKFKREKDKKYLPKIEMLGKSIMLLGILIVILAVYVFH